MFLKNTHPLVGEGVNQIDAADEQISRSDDLEITVSHESVGIQGDHEYTAGDGNAEKLSEGVEKEIIESADNVEPEEA